LAVIEIKEPNLSFGLNIGLRHWRPIIDPKGVGIGELHYPTYDGRRLLVSGPSPALLDKIDAEINFHASRSKEAGDRKCDGFAKLWCVDDNKPHNLTLDIDFPAHLWEELWSKATVPSVYGGLFVKIDAHEGQMPCNELVPVLDPSITFYIDHAIP